MGHASAYTPRMVFQVSNIDKRVYLSNLGPEFVINLVVVDDMTFVSNPTSLLNRIKQRLAVTFDVKLVGGRGCDKEALEWIYRFGPNDHLHG